MPAGRIYNARDATHRAGSPRTEDREGEKAMGRNLDDIRRLREKLTASQPSEEATREERHALKSRIMGLLLEDARNGAGRSVEDAAGTLGVAPDAYRALERGEATPSLPQLEVLAYFYNVPVGHFWRGDTLAVERKEADIKQRLPDILQLRQRILGLQIRQLREQAGLTLGDVAEELDIDPNRLEAVEDGAETLPLNELEQLAHVLKAGLDDLRDEHGPIGAWLQSQDDFESFGDLPADVRAFILNPINRSYLDLAIRLSDLEVDRLRSIAESILEITL